MFDYDLEHIFSYTVTIDEPEMVGPVPGGVRANFYASGGEVTGPKLTGKVTPSGATGSPCAPTGSPRSTLGIRWRSGRERSSTGGSPGWGTWAPTATSGF